MPVAGTSALAESYRLQALVAAEHATARTASDTRWDRICDHYAALVELSPSPAVRLAAAVALAERDGPRAGLDALDGLDDELPRSHRLPAVRGELLARLGEDAAAVEAFDLAVERCAQRRRARPPRAPPRRAQGAGRAGRDPGRNAAGGEGDGRPTTARGHHQ